MSPAWIDFIMETLWTQAPSGYETFSCSTQMSMEFQLLIKELKCWKMNNLLVFKLSDVVFIMLLNVKMSNNIYEKNKFHV